MYGAAPSEDKSGGGGGVEGGRGPSVYQRNEAAHVHDESSKRLTLALQVGHACVWLSQCACSVSTVLCSALLCSAVQFNAVQNSAMSCHVMSQFCSRLRNTPCSLIEQSISVMQLLVTIVMFGSDVWFANFTGLVMAGMGVLGTRQMKADYLFTVRTA